MTANEHDLQALRFCCKDDREAIEFLLTWRQYVHAIDDIVDGDRPGPEFLLSTFALAAALYSLPFYLRNINALRQIVFNCTNAYTDSVLWETAPVPWRREFADQYRHFGAEMVLAVSLICGGYEHMRAISPELRTICYLEHHTPEGNPI